MTDENWTEVFQQRALKLEAALVRIARLSAPASPIGIVANDALVELEKDRRRFETGDSPSGGG